MSKDREECNFKPIKDTYFYKLEKIDKLDDNIALRYYQEEAIKECLSILDSKEKRGQVLMATGTGKSVVFCNIIKRTNITGKILILVPSLLLLEQIRKELEKCIGESKIQKVDGSVDTVILNYKFYISTYQSSFKLEEIEFGLVIHDEAHLTCLENNESYFRLNLERNCKHLFFTATERIIHSDGDGYFSMDDKEVYGDVIYRYNLDTAIRDRYLTDFNIRICQDKENKLNCISKLYLDNTISHSIVFL